VNASHPYQLIVREKNVVEVTFPNIQLADSNSNEAASHGFVQLSLKPVPGLGIGEEIRNDAGIFFDYNQPVLTNEAVTTVNIISGIAGTRKPNFKLFPNPAKAIFKVELPQDYSGNWRLTHVTGSTFLSGTIEHVRSFEVPVDQIPVGIYLLSLQSGNDVSSTQVVIMR
jgi:hypothetical protein